MTQQKPSAETPPKSKKKVKKTEDATAEKEINGYEAEGLPEPTRYGDWEVKGRCSDF